VIKTQEIYMKRAVKSYLETAQENAKLADMYARLAKSAGGGAAGAAQ
jgi:hypothetical protein